MRATIKVFLKTEMKKRENSRPKEPQESIPATPSEQSVAPQSTSDPTDAAPSEPPQPERNPDTTPSDVSEATPKVDNATAPDATKTEEGAESVVPVTDEVGSQTIHDAFILLLTRL